MEPDDGQARDPGPDPDGGPDRGPDRGPDQGPDAGPALFTSAELTRIYREEAAAAVLDGRRLTVLLAPYGAPRVSPRRHGEA